jgi:hypothetical protein
MAYIAGLINQQPTGCKPCISYFYDLSVWNLQIKYFLLHAVFYSRYIKIAVLYKQVPWTDTAIKATSNLSAEFGVGLYKVLRLCIFAALPCIYRSWMENAAARYGRRRMCWAAAESRQEVVLYIWAWSGGYNNSSNRQDWHPTKRHA